MKILWLKTELLHPVDKGGKIRTYNMLKELKRDHHITYLTLDDGANQAARAAAIEYCHELITIPHRAQAKFTTGFYLDLVRNLVSTVPYAISKYQSPAMKRAVASQVRDGSFDVVVCDFLTPAVNLNLDVDCPTALFQHNVEAMIWKRHYQVATNPLKKLYLFGQWLKMRAFERYACRQFDIVIAVSAEDRQQIKAEYGIDAVFDVPTGVDTLFFQPNRTKAVDPHNLVFTGSMDWLPNEDAIRYFTETILPLIKTQIREVTLTVVGRNPYPALLSLAESDPSVIVTGRVDDVRPYMDQAAAYVVPLRIGGGTRLKIYEAMAMGKAIVSTTVGAEGLPVTSGQELLLADSPEAFAESIVNVLRDAELNRRLGESASRTVRERFGWEQVAREFTAICERVAVPESQLAVENVAAMQMA